MTYKGLIGSHKTPLNETYCKRYVAELVRYFKLKTKLCFYCFVLLSYLKYEQPRKDLLDIARNNCHNFNHLQMEEQLNYLLNSGCLTGRKVAKFYHLIQNSYISCTSSPID